MDLSDPMYIAILASMDPGTDGPSSSFHVGPPVWILVAVLIPLLLLLWSARKRP